MMMKKKLMLAACAGLTAIAAVPATQALAQEDPIFVSEYADATFTRGSTTLRLAPGEIDDNGTLSDALAVSVTKSVCADNLLVVTEASLLLEAPEIAGLSVNARGGQASIEGTVDLTGTVTVTPAGRKCATPDTALSVVSPITTPVTVSATWRNQRNSVPVIYSGADCGGDGLCYYRDASARATWSSPFIGSASASTNNAFLFEGTYFGADAAETASVVEL
jgi:hypothetical protein